MARKKKAPAIGIDLGTTCSSVAVWKDGRVWVIQDEEGNISIPSYVAFTHRRILIGTAAADQAAFNPKNTIFDVKRLIGRRFTDQFTERDRERWPFEVIAAGEKPMIVVKEKQYFPEEITAMIVGKMKYIAEAYLGKRVKQAVITVPAHFTDSQRQATKDAGAIAGLKVLRIINEPTAAALAYGLDKKNSTSGARNVLIFDLGGGTFDVSILAMEEGIFEVKATAGDSHLGGEDFDNRMVDHFVKKFKEENDKDITGDFTALSILRAACEKAKKTLSWYDDTTLEIHSLFQGIGLNATITRKKFEELNEHLFNRCMELVNRCLKDVNMKKSGIDEIVLVGGSTRIPKIKELLEDNFKGIPFCKSQRNEAVCYGAALQAAMLQKVNQVPDVVTVDVTPLSIGIETAQGKIDVVISRNEQIPISVEWMLTPESNKIYESDGRRWSRYKNLVGAIELNSRSSDPCIKVSFEIDVDGILSIKAEKKRIPIDKARLSRSEITKMAVEAVREVQEYKLKVAAKKYFLDYVFSKRERIEVNDLESSIEKVIDRSFVLYEILDEDSLHDHLPTMMKQITYCWFE